METTNNFKLNSFIITIDGKEISLSINQVIYIRYLEDIESATKMMEVQITDSNSGLLSLLRGMERVYIEIEDTIGNQIGGIFTVYDIQDRVSEGTISKATILLCTSDFINNLKNRNHACNVRQNVHGPNIDKTVFVPKKMK